MCVSVFFQKALGFFLKSFFSVKVWPVTLLRITFQLQLKLAPEGEFFVQNKRKLNQMLFSIQYYIAQCILVGFHISFKHFVSNFNNSCLFIFKENSYNNVDALYIDVHKFPKVQG